MTNHNTPLELLLVEDNPADAELTIDALLATGLVNNIKWVKDGAEALELLVGSQKKSTALLNLKLVILLQIGN